MASRRSVMTLFSAPDEPQSHRVRIVLAEKFVSTGTDGKVTNRAQTLADAKATHWTSVAYENLEVVAYGDAAVATGVYVAKGTDSKGKPMDERERFTDTWVKMPGGKWQCVASHGSTVKK